MRKAPRQARSRATVEAIVEAGAHVLGRRGWAGFTTNEVAEVAGASIGSLYQYFPNKLALLEAIRRRHFEDVRAVARAARDEGASLARRVEALVRGMAAAHGGRPALHRALLDEAPRSEADADAGAFEADYLSGYGALIAAAEGRAGCDCDPIAAQVLAAAVENVIHDAARRGTLETPALGRELTKLINGYLAARRQTWAAD